MEAYFDNSATTCVTEDVSRAVVKMMTEDFGNPSSKHHKGVEAEHYLRQAREIIADTMKVDEKEIYFTSGATESNNWALIGSALANARSGKHVITTAVEHASVLMPMHFLQQQGFEVTYLPVDEYGRISTDDLKKALRKDTILAAVMYVNNEVGAIEPVEEAGKIIKDWNRNIIFHVDAVQAYGKLRIRPRRMNIDTLSVSSHKIHGPKGAGFLYVRDKAKINPLILGGGQQKGMRSGTDNVPGAWGMAVAARDCSDHFAEDTAHLLELKKRMMDGLRSLDHTVLHSLPGQEGAPHIVSCSFPGIRSEVLLHALEAKGIYVSSGSACSSNRNLPVSTVLAEMHLPEDQLESTLRFSFSRYNTAEEEDYALEVLRELLPKLRRYTRH